MLTLANYVFKRENGYETIVHEETTKLSKEMKGLILMAFSGIIEKLYNLDFPTKIKDYHLLESFIFSNFAKPKYAKGDYVKVLSFDIERIPKKELNVEITDVVIDTDRLEIFYLIQYDLDNQHKIRTVKEEKNLGLQKQEFTFKNSFGRSNRDDLERFRHLKMFERISKI